MTVREIISPSSFKNLCVVSRIEADKYEKSKWTEVYRVLNLWQCPSLPSLDMLLFKLFSLQLAHLCRSLLETISSNIFKSSALKEK